MIQVLLGEKNPAIRLWKGLDCDRRVLGIARASRDLIYARQGDERDQRRLPERSRR
jgi:hypothetical protein